MKKELSGEALALADMDGQIFFQIVNSYIVKKVFLFNLVNFIFKKLLQKKRSKATLLSFPNKHFLSLASPFEILEYVISFGNPT